MIQNADFIKDFVEEAASHIESVEVGLLKLEEGAIDDGLIHGIFRNVHSIKGSAGFFGLHNIVKLSHAMENLFGEIRNGNLAIDQRMIDILLSANDCLKNMIAETENSEQTDISGHLGKIEALLRGCGDKGKPQDNSVARDSFAGSGQGQQFLATKAQDAVIQEAARCGRRVFRIDTPRSGHEDFLTQVKSIGQVVAADQDKAGAKGCLLVATVLEKGLLALALDMPEENITEMTVGTGLPVGSPPQTEEIPVEPIPPALRDSSAGVQPVSGETGTDYPEASLPFAKEVEDETKKPQPSGADDSLRVHVSLLNEMLNLASEMVLARNQLLRILETYRKGIPGLNAVLQNIDLLTSELQEKIMQTRMQPLSKVFNKFPRMVRELSKRMEKEIKLEMEGTEVELDKSIIEALGDPLTHLIRNAADHGIEIPEVREHCGKHRTGTILIKAYHEGGHVNLDIVDDGKGINVENVKLKAQQKGLITRSEINAMGERELLELIFRPGFSTAEKVTDVSGRGVGMDVVKTNIEKLGGTMEIITSSGGGTTIRLTLPLTLAIISSLIVEDDGKKFALPQVNLEGMVRVRPGDFSRRIEKIGETEVLRLRGRLLPIVRLSEVLGSSVDRNPINEAMLVLIVKNGSKRFGLVVQQIHDTEEILVKPVPRHFDDCRCFSGVTIMGDGRIAMILDPDGIAVKANLRFADEEEGRSAKDNALVADSIKERQNLLLFKCSGSETFSIDLSMVARVEKIQAEHIEKIGEKEFIQYRGEALRVIRPENYLPVTRGPATYSRFMIIPKMVNTPLGILIDKIIDTIETKIKLNREDIKAKGLVGSTILDHRIVLLIDVYELFEMADDNQLDDKPQPDQKVNTILVVEDTPFFARMEKLYLESAGYNVLTAANGDEAWKKLQDNKIDAVVSDIEMPVMDGFELVRRIRADKRLNQIPVIAVTSKTDEKSVNRGMEAGFDFYEIKLDRDRLLEKVSLVLRKRGEVV